MFKNIIIRKILLVILVSITSMAKNTPLAPINAGTYNPTDTTIRLSFKDISNNEDGFKIYWKDNLLSELDAQEGIGYRYVTLTGLTPNTLYVINIVAFNKEGSSVPLVKMFRTKKLPNPPVNPKSPIRPSNLGTYNTKIRSTRLSFLDNSDNEDGFRVYSEGKVIAQVGAKKGKGTYQYVNITKLEPNKLYTIKLVAYNKFGESDAIIKNFRTKPISAKVQIQGDLKEANINIFRFEDNGSKSLLFSEITDKNGKFEDHRNELEDNRLYLYEASQGVDIKNSIDNNGTIRAIVKGSWLKNLNQEFIISVISEMAYIFVDKDLRFNFDVPTISDTLQDVSKIILTKDITGDNNITTQDLLVFDYSKDFIKLNHERYTNNEMKKIVFDLYKNHIYRNMIFSSILDYTVFYKSVSVFTDNIEILTLEWINKNLWYLPNQFVLPSKLLSEKRFVVGKLEVLSKDKTRLYKLENNGLSLYNVKDSNNPILITRYILSPLGGKSIGITLSEDEKKAFIVTDETYVDFWTEANVYSLATVDISAKEINFPKIKDYGYDKYAKFPTYKKTIFIGNNIKISTEPFKLVISDISNPNNPIVLSTYQSLDDIRKVILSKDNKILIIASGNSIELLDISDIQNPTLMDSYNVGNTVKDITVSSDFNKLFVANHQGFNILDISNPYNLNSYIVSLKYDYFPINTYFRSVNLSPDEKSIFLLDDNDSGKKRLIEIDVTDIKHPSQVAIYY